MVNQQTTRRRGGPFARVLRYAYLKLVRKNDTPERVGRGVGIGVFVGIFPTLWFGPALTVLLAGLLHANRAAALLGSFACGPLTPFTWTLAAVVGNQLVPEQYRIAVHMLTWANREAIIERFFITFLLGNVIVSIVFSLAGYALIWWLAARRQNARAQRAPAVAGR